ncbi:DUF4336 domain-containing protein [Thalassococcus sp. CAU 1522]|uniref:DUF4336 domain-containing protein n=1 Tax=Thalassococcus arenae TaxID=2851652 RepID=A0ABS6N4Q2_9RHOB|nr:DUF4336 domain-containing protein [Thalassococcus arenae]MBV2358983.1 DUF4336 domain-containing protein [Thalassococcus arenae]
MLSSSGPDLWIADGPPITAAAGFHYPTRMAVARLADGGLWLWSPVAFDAALRDAVAALGPVAHLVAPNALHHMALADWAAAFPDARLHAAPGLRAKRAELAWTDDLGADPHPGWAGQIDQAVFPNAIAPEIVFFHRASGTALFTDLLQQMPPGWYRGWRGLVARLDGMTGPEPAVPRKFRLAARPRAGARAALAQIAAWPVETVLMAHGNPVTRDAPGFLRRAFRWLG